MYECELDLLAARQCLLKLVPLCTAYMHITSASIYASSALAGAGGVLVGEPRGTHVHTTASTHSHYGRLHLPVLTLSLPLYCTLIPAPTAPWHVDHCAAMPW